MPTSPGISLYEDDGKLSGTANVDTGASRRIRPGTKREDMAEGPPLVELHEIDSAFQLTEHLKALHYSHTHPADSNTIVPVGVELARQLSQPPPNTAKEIWLYELARFLIQKTNAIIVNLFADAPPCSPNTCPEMRASEWQYLCAVHDPPKSCAAIDYCCHTLDWAATSLTSSKMFPSRLGLGSGNAAGGSDKVLQQQMKEITNIFRRVYRIYAHAWFQHRDMFWRVEESTGLYIFFKTVCDEYGMIQPENYTIPPEAEGHPPQPEDDVQERPPPPVILRPESEKTVPSEPAGNHVVSLGDTTKRHTRVPSNVAMPVSTVIQEEAEEEDDITHVEKSSEDSKTIPFPEALPEPGDKLEEELEVSTKEEVPDEITIEDKSQEEEKAAEETTGAAKEDVALPTIARSNTIVPAEDTPAVDETSTIPENIDDQDLDEVTVLLDDSEIKSDEPDIEVKIEAGEPTESLEVAETTAAAADAEVAGKSVED